MLKSQIIDTMAHSINVLIVDDHPLIIKAHKLALKHLCKGQLDYHFNIETANNCDEAYTKILQASNCDGLDLVLLDISLPASEDGKIISGEDLGIIIRDVLPKAKVIISTTYTQNIRLNSLMQSVNPDGFLIKTDITSEILTEAIESIIEESPYYSKTVLNFLRKKSSNDFVLDKTDRRLLYELTKGARMNELPNLLNLSLAAVERRKRILKEVFSVGGMSDRELILSAEINGFV